MRKTKDITGQKFNRLTAIQFSQKRNEHHFWEFLCDCGNKKIIESSNVINGKTKSCGCFHKERAHEEALKRGWNIIKDITRKKFGELTAVKFYRRGKDGRSYWIFKCDCGNEKVICGHSVEKGDTKTCGHWKDGRSKTKLYRTFYGILQRCNNKKCSAYQNYGSRGIKCLWNSFEEFKNDMHESYKKHCEKFGKENTSLNRIDNNSNYSKENCRWATRSEQQKNKSNNVFVNFMGKTQTITEWKNELRMQILPYAAKYFELKKVYPPSKMLYISTKPFKISSHI